MENSILITHHMRNNLCSIDGGMCMKVMFNLTITPCQDYRWTLGIFGWLASKICWGNLVNSNGSFDVTTISSVPPPSHNVAAMQNIINSWILEMAIVSMKKKSIIIAFATPNKLFGALVSNRTKRPIWHS